MAKPNYSYEKRQRELAKKQKKEEKLKRKNEGGSDQDIGDETPETSPQPAADAAES
ncbi:hypothetical protein Q9Q94_07270 [Uliginosibacterium sp. 31-16]|uniref:hypothetical protein n=1 Tax=Uliginosibacterium sp. 31-16 TaxID=3068315 RepID=UPI00273E42DB|nr:hypothetical protein [Uliginosibacterium sp. 31-16]MDP5239324.1 hypothetical protein [Uliginosibacterium sp. 31-16]